MVNDLLHSRKRVYFTVRASARSNAPMRMLRGASATRNTAGRFTVSAESHVEARVIRRIEMA